MLLHNCIFFILSSSNVASHLAMRGSAAARIQRSPFFCSFHFITLRCQITRVLTRIEKRNTEKTFGLIGCEKYNEIESRFSREIAKYTGAGTMPGKWQLPQ